MSTYSATRPFTIPWVRAQKGVQKLTMLTAYDYPTAVLLDEAGIEMLLVGDSVASVVYGEPNTLGVTLETMLGHTRAVSRGAKRAIVIGDMPFLSYQVSAEDAIRNAGRFLKEAGAHAVKLEGGLEFAETVKTLTRAGIPVVGHIGLTPQTVYADGGYRMHGKSEEEKKYLLDSARALAEAGAFAIVLECIESELARQISESVAIPTIGIGSGAECDGQVLVVHDLIGLTVGRVPKFVEQAAQVKDVVKAAAEEYVRRTKTAPQAPKEPHALSH